MTTRTFTFRALLPITPIAGLLILTACSGSGGGTGGAATTTTTKQGTGGGTTTTSATGGSTGSTTSSEMTCPAPMKYGGGETTTTMNTVTAKIVDETGAPIAAGQPVYICGTNLCSPPGATKADGTASISSNLSLKKAAFKVGDTIDYAEMAIPLTMATTDFTSGGTAVLTTAKLAGKTGAALTPGMDAVSGDVTISVPAGGSVGIDGIVYDTPDKALFRAVSIPVAGAGPWLAAAPVTGFQLLYGVGPSESTLCPAAKVTVALPHATMTPNDLGWAGGTAVEFWVMTTDTAQQYAPYAGWAKMSTGTVSADGKTVSTDASGGFIFLENFAIRKAQ